MITLSLRWQRFARWWKLKGKRSPGLYLRFQPVWRWTASWSKRWPLPSRRGSCSSNSSLGRSHPCCGSSTREPNTYWECHNWPPVSQSDADGTFRKHAVLFLFCDELWFVDSVSWQTFSCCLLFVFVCLRVTKLHIVIADYLNISAQCFMCKITRYFFLFCTCSKPLVEKLSRGHIAAILGFPCQM